MHIRGQSTKVTEYTSRPRRLPAYWFESRRRYFAVTFGTRLAMLIDVVALLAHSIGSVKRVMVGKGHEAIPRFIRDLLHHSILWKRNRDLPAVQCFLAPPRIS